MSAPKRAKVTYIDPLDLPQPGRCLRADGIYRARMGWPQQPALLTEDEVAQVRAAGMDVPRQRPGDRQP